MQPFDRDILILLNDVSRLVRTRADQRARTKGMTRAQWIILARVERQPGLSQSELAALCEVEPITIVRLVDRLEKRGVLERRRDAEDRRINRLYLTPAAAPLMRELSVWRDLLADEATAGLDPETLDALTEILLTIKSNLCARESVAAPPRVPTPSAAAE